MGTCEYCGVSMARQGHLGQCKKYKEYLDNVISEAILKKLYVEDGLSAYQISKQLGVASAGTIIARLKKHNIKTRTVKEATQTKDTKSRRAKTNLKRYGAENVFARQSTSRKKWQTRLYDEEGITNVFQRESVKIKSAKTILKKYGVESPSKLSRGVKPYSSLNRRLYSILVKNGIVPHVEFKLKAKKQRYYSYDFLIPNTKKIIEINGDYWHGNPKLYKPNDLILKGSSGEVQVKNKWMKDKEKIDNAKRCGFEVLVIWELDLNNSEKEITKRILEYAAQENN